MQKPLAYANDLADHDVIEDDSALVFGPHPSKLPVASASPVSVPPARQQQLGSSSVKHQDTSILGSAPVVAKLAQSPSMAQSMILASRTSPLDGHVYAGGNPVISTAPASRPSSAARARQPRNSAPSGETPTDTAPAADSSAASKSVHGGTAFAGEAGAAAAARPDGSDSRAHGADRGERSNSGGGGDTRSKTGLLRRLSSLTSLSRPASRPPSAKREGDDGAAPWAVSKGADGSAAVGPAPSPGPQMIRGSALPCVDVEGERKLLLRRLSLRETPAALTSASRLTSAGAAAAAAGPAPGASPEQAPPPAMSASATAPEASPASAVGASAPPERPSTPLRRLTRLLSAASLIAPSAAVTPSAAAVLASSESDQLDQDGAGAGKGRISSAGVREVFSRPSSARRKSEAGGSRGSQAQVPLEAWKHTRPALPVEISDDGPADDRVQDFGAVVVRQPSGVFKRAANALAAALAR